MKPDRAGDYLAHMIEAIDRIFRYVTGVEREAFMRDTLLQDGVIRNFEIIGEAARNLERTAPNFIAAHPEVPWRTAMVMRNRLSHGYFNVDFDSVWATVINDLPRLRGQLEGLTDK